MDCSNAKIHQLNDEDIKMLGAGFSPERDGRHLAPLSESQNKELTPMNAHERKGYMRNQPCICGSGKKFKRCCWGDYS